MENTDHIEDLRLAQACGRGDPDALARFDQEYLAEAVRVREAQRAPSVSDDELRQHVRERLFVAKKGQAPKILEYSGQGPLLAWVRVVVARALINLGTRGERAHLIGDEALARLTEGPLGVPSTSSLSFFHQPQVQAAFAQAMRSLPREARVLLRQRFLDDVSLDGLAQLHAVNRATISRRLFRAREELVVQTKAGLRQTLPKASEHELDSLLSSAALHLDVSMSALMTSVPESTAR